MFDEWPYLSGSCQLHLPARGTTGHQIWSGPSAGDFNISVADRQLRRIPEAIIAATEPS